MSARGASCITFALALHSQVSAFGLEPGDKMQSARAAPATAFIRVIIVFPMRLPSHSFGAHVPTDEGFAISLTLQYRPLCVMGLYPLCAPAGVLEWKESKFKSIVSAADPENYCTLKGNPSTRE